MKRLILVGIAITLILIAISPVLGAGKGTIRISPALPVMVKSPATFEIWIEGAAQSPTQDPHILLVMTKSSYDGLTGDVVVTWIGSGSPKSFSKADFTAVKTGFVPPSGAEEGGRYTVASLQDHLGVEHSEDVYYALGAFLSGPITQAPQEFTVTLPSKDPRMEVYAIGKLVGECLFSNKVPPTIPGFVVPELAPVLLASASFSALAVYAFKRRKM